MEAAEAAVRAAGLRGDLRVRDFDATARLELPLADVARVRDDAALAAALWRGVTAAGYAQVELDLRGFASGRHSTAGVGEGAGAPRARLSAAGCEPLVAGGV